MEIQRILGSDIAMVFDECRPHDAPAKEQRLAVERTIRWARECREQPRAADQKVFGIVQGRQRRCVCASNAPRRSSGIWTATPSAA